MQKEPFLSELMGKFLSKLKDQGKTENTIKNYKTDLHCYKGYLESFQESDRLQRTDLQHVIDYGSFLQVKYTSDNSRRRRVQTLRLFYDFLLVNGHVKENPVRKIPASPKFVDTPKPTNFGETLSWWKYLAEEVKCAKDGLPTLIAQRNQILFSLIFFGGIKVSQLSELQVDDLIVDQDNSRVMVTHQKRDPYTVILPTYLRCMISEYKVNLTRGKVASSINFSEALFNANPHRILSGGLSPRGIEIIFEDIRGKINAEATPKKLREAAVCRWINLSIPAQTIKEWMGVAPSYSLNRFTKISDNFFYSEEAFEQMSITQ
jgi:integrase/recombinase XerC